MTLRERELEVWPARDGWRWRAWGWNGHLQAESGQAYETKARAVTAASHYDDERPVVVRDAMGRRVIWR